MSTGKQIDIATVGQDCVLNVWRVSYPGLRLEGTKPGQDVNVGVELIYNDLLKDEVLTGVAYCASNRKLVTCSWDTEVFNIWRDND